MNLVTFALHTPVKETQVLFSGVLQMCPYVEIT